MRQTTGPITNSFVFMALIGVVLTFVGIGMTDGSIWETITLFPGLVMYFVGLVGGLISFIVWQGNV